MVVGFIYFILDAKLIDFPTQYFNFLFERIVKLLEEGVHFFFALVGVPPLKNEGRYFLFEVLRSGFEFLVLIVVASHV